MKLNILTDIHNEFTVLPVPKTEADVVILAGDIDLNFRAIPWAVEFGKPVIYILGNHEFYNAHVESVKEQIRELTHQTNIHFLDDEEVVINGVRFIGGTLWTDFKLFGEPRQDYAMRVAQFKMSDYQVIRTGSDNRRFLPEDSLLLNEKTLAFLKQAIAKPFSGKTVVVTHHAPSLQSVESHYKLDPLTPAFASDLEYLMDESVCLWVHGHMHHSNDYEINGTRILSNPRGYEPKGQPTRRNPDFDPGLIIEI